MISTSPSSIRIQTTLKQDALISLLKGEILALQIPLFVEESLCHQWANKIVASSKLSPYSHATDVPVTRIGMTLFETENKISKLNDYLRLAPETYPRIEQILAGDNPLKFLHQQFQQSWINGCEVVHYKGHMMNPGILRAFEANPDGGLPPHVDSLLKDLPDDLSLRELQCQLAANLYISTGRKGGQLEIWDFMPEVETLPSLFDGQHDFLDRSKLTGEPQVLQPCTGDLILFRSNCVHAVRPVQEGMRIAASCFIGYFGEKHSLRVWA